jgi:hypothetical protein
VRFDKGAVIALRRNPNHEALTYNAAAHVAADQEGETAEHLALLYLDVGWEQGPHSCGSSSNAMA